METSEYEATSERSGDYARLGLEQYGHSKRPKVPEFLSQAFLSQACAYFRRASEAALVASQLTRTRKECEYQERRVLAYERFRLRVEAGLDFVINNKVCSIESIDYDNMTAVVGSYA